MTVRLLYAVGDDPKGAVIDVDDRRAQRLIVTGYAQAMKVETPERKGKRWRKDSESV